MRKWFTGIAIGVMFLALMLPTPFLAQGQGRVLLTLTQVDNSSFPQMIAFVTITDPAGAPVKGLDKSNFEAFEDGRSVPVTEVTTVDQSQLGLAVALVMDSSGSMKGQPLQHARDAAIEFIHQLTARDECAVFSFANDVKTLQDFAKDRNACINAINSLEASGNTALHEALFRAAKSLGSRPPGRKVVILFTDGEQYPPNPAWTLDDGIAEANNSGVPVYTAGLKSPDYKAEPLQKVAEKTNGRYFQAESSEQLKGLYQSIAEQLKNQYVVKYTSDLLADQKSHGLLIKVKTPQGEADGIKSFVALPPPKPYVRPLANLKDGEEVKPEAWTITPEFIAQRSIARVEYYVDDILKFTTTTPPFSFLWNAAELAPGLHTLTVKAFDNAVPANEGMRRVEFKVLEKPTDWTWLLIILGGVLLVVVVLVIVLLTTRRPPMPVPEVYPPYVPGGPTAPGVPTLGPSIPTPGPTVPPTIPTAGPLPSGGVTPPPPKTEILHKPPQAMAYLIMTKGERVGKEFRLQADGETTIGRDAAACDVVVSDGAVSRQHAKVRLEGGVFYIYDLATTNHTFVNEQEIQRQPLQDDDTIRMGETTFVFKQVKSR